MIYSVSIRKQHWQTVVHVVVPIPVMLHIVPYCKYYCSILPGSTCSHVHVSNNWSLFSAEILGKG